VKKKSARQQRAKPGNKSRVTPRQIELAKLLAEIASK